MLAAVTRPADALDPNRALTQAVHRIWQVQQGLPEGTVTCIYQTHDLYLLLGTRTGLVRFDGVQFFPIRNVGGISLENVWIRDLCEDAEHRLWIATDGVGLIRWQGSEARHYGPTDGLPSAHVRCVRVDRRGQVWAGTELGLARIADDQLETFADPELHREIRALCETPDGQMLVGGSGNLLQVADHGKFTSQPIDRLPSSTAITALACSADGTRWIGSTDGLVQQRNGEHHYYSTGNGLPNDSIYCLLEDAAGSLWIGTADGLGRLNHGEFESFQTENGLSQSTVYSLCEDHEHTLWVGTKLGLNQFFDRRTIPFTTAEGLPSNNTGPILQDAAGTIWVGTLDAGLARFDDRHFTTLTVADGLPSDTILALAAAGVSGDAAPALWIGTDRGVCRLVENKVVETFTAADGLPNDTIRALCQSRDGTLWIGTPSGLIAWRGGSFVRPARADGEEPLAVTALLNADDGSVIVATHEQGLYRCREDRCEKFPSALPPSLHITALYQRPPGTLYVGTRDRGLYLLRENSILHLTVREGLYDDEIYGITDDDQGHLWLGCSKGIFSLQFDELQAYSLGKLTAVKAMPLSPLDALRTVECQGNVQPALQTMRDGRVWFATIRGALVVDPSHWQRILPPTKVAVEAVTVNGQEENPERPIQAGRGAVNAHFRYTALSYTSPTRITFRYRLDGFDNDWVEAGSRREAFYTNLPPGDYRFRVAAENVDGKLYETAAPVVLHVTPRLYQHVWFFPACAAVIVLAGWAAYRLRVRRVRQQMNAVLAERSRIARELHDTLLQGFFGVTMEMQALASRWPESAERQALDEIIDDAGKCLREARRSVAGLRGDASGLPVALQQTAQQITETQNVRLRLNVEPVPHRLTAETEYNLLRIAQEAISNAVKHSGAHTIDVTLAAKRQVLQLTIQDDGTGFSLENGEVPGLGHYGLIGMRERANQIGAEFHLESKAGRGTTVRVLLPLLPSAAETVA